MSGHRIDPAETDVAHPVGPRDSMRRLARWLQLGLTYFTGKPFTAQHGRAFTATVHAVSVIGAFLGGGCPSAETTSKGVGGRALRRFPDDAAAGAERAAGRTAGVPHAAGPRPRTWAPRGDRQALRAGTVAAQIPRHLRHRRCPRRRRCGGFGRGQRRPRARRQRLRGWGFRGISGTSTTVLNVRSDPSSKAAVVDRVRPSQPLLLSCRTDDGWDRLANPGCRRIRL